ncbi:MAG: winged helix-turn-helix domain-containing protein [Roseiarcus sp.]
MILGRPNAILSPPCLRRRALRPRSRPRAPSSRPRRKRLILAAMQDNPGLSERALANAVDASRSATGERLRQLAQRGVVEKDPEGRWRVKGVEAPYAAAVSMTAEETLELVDPKPAAAYARWVRSIGGYDRRERHEFAVTRYG